MKKNFLFIPVCLLLTSVAFAGERIPYYGSFTKYPHKVYQEGLSGEKVCAGGAPTHALNIVCLAEGTRYLYEPRPGVPGEDDGVYINGRYSCPRNGCYKIFENDITHRILPWINKKLNDTWKRIFIDIYYYLSDWQKEAFFNAAVQYNQIDIVKAYIDYGIDVNAEITVDPGTSGLILWSTEIKYDHEYNDGLYAPLKKQEIYIRKMKPIEAARKYGYTEIIKLLEESGRLE
jgi:hypothetical protein